MYNFDDCAICFINITKKHILQKSQTEHYVQLSRVRNNGVDNTVLCGEMCDNYEVWDNYRRIIGLVNINIGDKKAFLHRGYFILEKITVLKKI